MLFKLSLLDPRTKMMMLVCLSTLAMFRKEPLFLAALLVFTLAILFLGGVEVQSALRQAKAILAVLIMLFFIQSFFNRSGEPFLVLGGITFITTGGIKLACILALRLFILVFSALIMLTGEPRDYLLALAQMKVPYEIGFMVMAAIHFIPILREEAMNVFYAVQLRGTELEKTSFREKLKIYVKICLPILVMALNRSKAMAVAMEARAFRVYPQRTYMRKLILQGKDNALLVLFPFASVALLVIINL